MHHPPYSSGPHGATLYMRWPFRQWGADLVLTGHDHIYERLSVDGLPYIVDGLGGATFYALGPPVPESQVRFTDGAGALRCPLALLAAGEAHSVDRRQVRRQAGPAIAGVLADPQRSGGAAEGQALAAAVDVQRMAQRDVIGVLL